MGNMAPTVGKGMAVRPANLLTIEDGLREALWRYLSVDKRRIYMYKPLLSTDKMRIYMFQESLSMDKRVIYIFQESLSIDNPCIYIYCTLCL